MTPTLLHIGCGPFKIDGFINTDKEFDITKPWPYEDNSVDGITSMHVLIEIPWRELVFTFKEMHRVLKPDGVLRFGVPHIDSGFPLEHLLGWGNINLFSEDLLAKVLWKIGFKKIAFTDYGQTTSKHEEIVKADNRPEETLFVEAIK